MKKRPIHTQPVTRLLFVLYAGFMLWLLFIRGRGSDDGLSYWQQVQTNINLLPLRTIRNYLYVLQHGSDPYLVQHCFVNIAGNVLLFIPAGLLLPRIWHPLRSFWRFFLCCTLTMAMVELLQLFTLRGSLDVDDLLLNLLGMLLGYFAYRITHRKKKEQ